MDRTIDRRQEILDTAGGLFRLHGYHATSMRDIARSLNLRGSSLYAHITSKEEMLEEIVRAAAAAFLAQAERVDGELAPAERLAQLIRGHLEVVVHELPNATVFFHEWKFLSAEARAEVIAWRDRYEGYFRTTIEAGVRGGVFRVQDPKLATIFILSALNWSYQWFREDGPLSTEGLAAHYTTLALNALNAEEVAP